MKYEDYSISQLDEEIRITKIEISQCESFIPNYFSFSPELGLGLGSMQDHENKQKLKKLKQKLDELQSARNEKGSSRILK